MLGLLVFFIFHPARHSLFLPTPVPPPSKAKRFPATAVPAHMDGNTALLCVVIAVQLYTAVAEVRSLLAADGDYITHLDTLSRNAIDVISTLLTAAYGTRLRKLRRSLRGVERTLRHGGFGVGVGGRWPAELRTRAWLTGAAVLFGYLKYGQLTESGVGVSASGRAAEALLRTVSTAGNYYVTVMFVDCVLLARRSVKSGAFLVFPRGRGLNARLLCAYKRQRKQ